MKITQCTMLHTAFGRRRRARSALNAVFASVAICSSIFLTSSSGIAQTSDAVAESLFRDGKRLFQSEDYKQACHKLAQSYQIDPAGGTVLLLAICYEKQGKLASAWTRYNDALTLAKRDAREDRERRAREGLDSVEPKLSYIDLKIDPATQAIAGVALSLDGTVLPAISDARLPVDAGKHQLTIRAPNYDSWRAEITVGGPAATENVTVPPLQSKPAASTPNALAPPSQNLPVQANQTEQLQERTQHGRVRATAYVIGGVGLAAVAVGSYFGIRAIRLNNQADQICPASSCVAAQAAAIPKSEDAIRDAHLSDVFIGAGSAAVISAAVLWYLYRNDPPASAPYAAVVPHAASLGYRGTF